jgi:RNA polymerase sigma-70 factor (ECF subfamily)
MSEAETASDPLPAEGETSSTSMEIPAFADAVTIHQSLVFSIACHLLHNTSLAEEAAQDVFLRLYRDYHKIRSASHLVHWLRRTATHRCLDTLRRIKKHRQIPLDEIEIALPSSATDQDPILARTLRRLVAELPGIARAVVVLRYQEDLEPREIARVLDLPVNTVKSRLQRALAVLRSRLAAFEESRHESNRG